MIVTTLWSRLSANGSKEILGTNVLDVYHVIIEMATKG
jgi:hypothetical protein